MPITIFPTRYRARKAAAACHVQGETLHVVRIDSDNTPDGRTGWAVESEDWGNGTRSYLRDGGSRWGSYAP